MQFFFLRSFDIFLTFLTFIMYNYNILQLCFKASSQTTHLDLPSANTKSMKDHSIVYIAIQRGDEEAIMQYNIQNIDEVQKYINRRIVKF